jgi:hypothetical protein
MWAIVQGVAMTLVLTLPIVWSAVWLHNRSANWRNQVLAAWGLSFFLASFFFLPWLDLQPLKHLGLAVLFDALPVLETFVRWFGQDFLLEVIEKVSSLELIFEPRGWFTLALVANIYTAIWLFLWGSSTFLLAWPVLLCFRWHKLGYFLSASSIVLLFTLFYSLPTIDGLGERHLPHPMALAVPVLGAELLWYGPVVMFIGLLLLALAGLLYAPRQDGQRGVFEDEA